MIFFFLNHRLTKFNFAIKLLKIPNYEGQKHSAVERNTNNQWTYRTVVMLGASLTLGSQGWKLEKRSWLESPENRSVQDSRIWAQTALPLNVSPGCGSRCERGIWPVKVWQTTSGRVAEGGKKLRPCSKTRTSLSENCFWGLASPTLRAR
jgi:hypothetical protein